jgi:hypothetical protein
VTAVKKMKRTAIGQRIAGRSSRRRITEKTTEAMRPPFPGCAKSQYTDCILCIIPHSARDFYGDSESFASMQKNSQNPAAETRRDQNTRG